MHLRSAALALGLAFAAVGCLTSVNTDPHGYRCGKDAECAGGLVCVAQLCANPGPYTLPVYRLNSTVDHGQLLTGDAGWVAALLDAGTYTSDGVVFLAVPTAATQDFFPVYQLHKRTLNDWLYSTSNGEKENILASGNWDDFGIAFYGRLHPVDASVPIWRVSQNSFHHWAVGNAEFNELLAQGYLFDDHLDGGPGLYEVAAPGHL